VNAFAPHALLARAIEPSRVQQQVGHLLTTPLDRLTDARIGAIVATRHKSTSIVEEDHNTLPRRCAQEKRETRHGSDLPPTWGWI
jgi:hypothetical protein